MNKKVVLSVLSATFVASMAASAFAAPNNGLYIGGNVKTHYSFETLIGLDDAGMAKFKADMAAIGTDFNNLVYVSLDKKGASIAEILAAPSLEEANKDPLKKEDFADVYSEIDKSGNVTGTYDARKDVDGTTPGELTVESVSAINATQLEIKFSVPVKKASVVDGTNTLVNGVFKFNNVLGDTLAASLSKDGKTLTVTAAAGTSWEGTFAVEIIKDKVETDEGTKLDHFVDTFVYDDTTRADIKEIVYVDSETAEIHLTEPVSGAGTISAKYEDSTLPAIVVNGTAAAGQHDLAVTQTAPTVLKVDLSDADLLANKNVVVSLPELTDLALPTANKSTPKSVTVVKNTTDTVKPEVASVVATAFDGTNTTFDIKLSEATKTASPTGITVNGTAATVTLDADDKTLLHGTVAAKVEGSALVYIPANAIRDLSNNGNAEVGKFYNFALDTAAPVVQSTSVERVSGEETLVVTYNENVTIDTAKAVTFSWTDAFGMTNKFVTTAAAGVSLYKPDASGKSKQVAINLNQQFSGSLNGGATSTLDLADNKAYKVTLGAGFVSDAYNNKSAAVADIAFTTTVVDSGNTKITATVSATDPGVVVVSFDKPVNATSAKDVANYAVEGATIKEAKLVSNNASGAVVNLILNDGTVEETGYYNVTVKPIAAYNPTDKSNEETVASTSLLENVRPLLQSAVLTNIAADTFTTKLTFNDSTVASTAGTGDDFELYVNGQATGEVLDVTVAAGVATVTWDETDDASINVSDLTTATSIKLVALDTIDIKDGNGNVVAVQEIVVK